MTLRERREKICRKFALKCVNDPVFERRSGRTGGAEIYLEEAARCERMKNLPIFYFTRLLNGKNGKPVGSRKREYKEDVVRD